MRKDVLIAQEALKVYLSGRISTDDMYWVNCTVGFDVPYDKARLIKAVEENWKSGCIFHSYLTGMLMLSNIYLFKDCPNKDFFNGNLFGCDTLMTYLISIIPIAGYIYAYETDRRDYVNKDLLKNTTPIDDYRIKYKANPILTSIEMLNKIIKS